MSNEVQNPIINSPFVEPKLHWQMTLQGDLEVGELEDLPIVNWLRSRIKAWCVGELKDSGDSVISLE